jgi:ribosome-binding protein aMBF1 (putative translation factor)
LTRYAGSRTFGDVATPVVPPKKRRRNSSSPYPELAALIRQRREQLGLTQTFVADKVDIDQTTLARWENAQRVPSGPAFERLRQFLRFSDAELEAATAPPA